MYVPLYILKPLVNQTQMDRQTLQKIAKLALAGLIVGTAITLIIVFRDPIFSTLSLVLTFLQSWLKDNLLLGSVLFILTQAIVGCILLPVNPLYILAGSVFPIYLAVILCWTGNLIGILVSIALGRLFLRPWVQKKLFLYPKLKSLDKVIEEDGFKLAVLLRLVPIPFGCCSWLFATSQVPVSIICVGSLLGSTPSTLIHCAVGALAGYGGEMPPRLQRLTILLTVCFAIGSSIFITLMAKKALRNVVDLNTVEIGEIGQIAPSSARLQNDSQTPLRKKEKESYSTTQETTSDIVSSSPISPILPSSKQSDLDIPLPLREERQNCVTQRETLILQTTFASVMLALCIGIPIILLL